MPEFQRAAASKSAVATVVVAAEAEFRRSAIATMSSTKPTARTVPIRSNDGGHGKRAGRLMRIGYDSISTHGALSRRLMNASPEWIASMMLESSE